MNMNRVFQEERLGRWLMQSVAMLLLAVLLQGCLGGGSEQSTTTASGDGDAGGGATIDANVGAIDSSNETYQFGMIRNGSFTQGAIDVGLDELAAGGSVSLSVAVVDATGTPVSKRFDVSFNSVCNSNGLAAIESPVATVNGVATTTYQAKGCSGEDVITARLTIDQASGESTELQAIGKIRVKSADLGSIEFVSAEPSTIALKGMGGAGLSHTATVRFRVLNVVGGPAANQRVKFALNTSVGGIALQPSEGRTDNEGYVQTVVEAGNVHTSVRVTAETQSATGEVIKSQSSKLVISTGIPDQNSVSLSLSVHNPEAWSYDGVDVDVNVYASDRYNNPVPDGTTVSFYTELGQVQPSCQTEDGFCTVKWRSSNPRVRGIEAAGETGRAAITAVMIGEDSFVDLDGDGLYGVGDRLETDEGEVFEDWVEGAVASFDAVEPFLDFNGNGQRDADGDGLFTGLGCRSGCAKDGAGNNVELKHVFDRTVLVLAESALSVTHDVVGNQINLDKGAGPTSASFTVTVRGLQHGQVPPAGTQISVETDIGKLYGPTSFEMPSSNSKVPVTLGFTLSAEGVTESKAGRIELKATTPKGVVSYGPSIGVSVTVP